MKTIDTEIMKRITETTVDLTLEGTRGEVTTGQGILLESGFVLTAAACVDCSSNAIACFAEGYEFVQEIVVDGGMVLSTTPWMIDQVSGFALLGPMHVDYHSTSAFELDFSIGKANHLPLFCKPMELLAEYVRIKNVHDEWVVGHVYMQSRWPHRLKLCVDEKASNLYTGAPVVTQQGELVGVVPRFVEGSKIHPGSEAYMALAHVALPQWAVGLNYKSYLKHYREAFNEYAPDYCLFDD